MLIAPGPRDDELTARAGVTNGTTRVLRLAGPSLPYDRTYHLLARFDKIRTRVGAENPDVLEAHSPYLGVAATLACGRNAARVRTAFWHSDHLSTYLVPALARITGRRVANAALWPVWHGIRALLAPFDTTFVAGKKQLERLRAAGVGRVEHVPFGVDVTTFNATARSDARRRELLAGAAPSTFLMVGVGRLAVEKRWDVVLDAFGRLRAERDAILVLFGDGPERSRLQQRASPGVRFAGYEPDRARLASALASADLLVHACPYETFGLAVAEAVASGLPVVVPEAGGADESTDPACAESYPSLDSVGCAAAIGRILARDRGALRSRALEASTRVLTLQGHFERVLSIYADLLRQREGERERDVARPRFDPRRNAGLGP
jgi:alpha-1,6-mannosyltransferase